MNSDLQSYSADVQKQIADFLDGLDNANKKICKSLRDTVIACMPGATEMLLHSALNYATSVSSLHRIVYIAPQKNHVNLGFFFGANIPDPSGLLEGDGKRMRHIKIYSEDAIQNPAIIALIEAAWKKAAKDIESITRKKIKK